MFLQKAEASTTPPDCCPHRMGSYRRFASFTSSESPSGGGALFLQSGRFFRSGVLVKVTFALRLRMKPETSSFGYFFHSLEVVSYSFCLCSSPDVDYLSYYHDSVHVYVLKRHKERETRKNEANKYQHGGVLLLLDISHILFHLSCYKYCVVLHNWWGGEIRIKVTVQRGLNEYDVKYIIRQNDITYGEDMD